MKEALDGKRKSLFEDGLEGCVYEHTLYFYSKSGSGIDDLKKTLVELAWSDPEKAQFVPKRWMKFQKEIQGLSVNGHVFALSKEKLIEIVPAI